MKILSRLNIKTKAGGPSEETFYKKWDESQRNSYLKEHPNSRFSKDNKSQEKPASNKIKRPTSYFNGELKINKWKEFPKGGYYDDNAEYIGQDLRDHLGDDNVDVKYADDGDSNFVSVLDKNTGKIYNIVIDDVGIDIMNEDMSDSYAAGESENGYFEPDELDSAIDFVKNKISPTAPKGNERKTSFFDGDVEIGRWRSAPLVGGNYDEDAVRIGNSLKLADITDVKYGTDGDKNIISVRNPNDGKLYNIIIDDFGVDIMNEDMNDTVLDLDSTNGNGYFDRYETKNLGKAVTKALKGLGF